MAKILSRKTNFRVEVVPRGLGDFGAVRTSDSFIYGRGTEAEARIERDYIARCEEIVSDVKRHVDNVHSAYVQYDQDHVCEHCGSAWTEASNTYNGGCCAKDEDNAQAATPTGEPT